MIIMFTCALGQLLIEFLLELNQNSSDIKNYLNTDYNHGMIILLIALISCALLVKFLPKTKKLN